jgi:hypothetical protein
MKNERNRFGLPGMVKELQKEQHSTKKSVK